MSERVRTDVSRDSLSRGPSPEDVRRQLEGRVEVVEAARGRYAALVSLLSGGKWKRRLREQPEALQAVLRQEPALEEALARIHRRAQTDDWPEELPVLATVRDLRALRARLEVLVHKRLGALLRVSSAPSLVEELARLEGLVLQPIPLEPAAGEVRLLEGDTGDVWLVFRIYALVLLCLPVIARVGVPGALALLAVFLVNLVYGVSQSGKYWLTSERLVWKPFRGEPVQIPLRSIPEDGIQPFFFGVRVVGEQRIHIQDVNQARVLALLLELRRQPPLLGSAVAEPLADVVCYEATLQGGSSRKGYVVLRPGYAAFLPKDKGAQVLRAITGARSSPGVRSIQIPPIIEQLRYLPTEAAFDACVERAVVAAGGVRWSAWDVRYDASAPVWKEIRILTAGPRPAFLRGKVGWSQEAVARRVLADWPKR